MSWAGAYEEGVAALKAGKGEEARAALGLAVEEVPGSADAHWELGWACWMLTDYAASVRAWERVATLQPDRPDLDVWLPVARVRSELAQVPASPAEVPLEAHGARIRFAAAGDTMMGSDLRKGPAGLAPGDGEALFTAVAPIFTSADVAFLNLEGPLADGLPSTKCRPGSTDCHAFRTPVRYRAALRSVGIDVVSLANNHALDLGFAGQSATMAALDAVGIAHAGRYGDVGRLEVKGLRVAVVAAHSGSCCLNVNDLEEVRRAVVLADQDADLVVFSFHGGAEGARARHVPRAVEVAWGEPRGDVYALARAVVDAGADIVLGHGPHVLRGMEVYRGRLIAYSLGNFVGYRQFGTGGGPTGHSVVLEAEVAANGVLTAARLHPIRLDGEGAPHPDPEGEGLAHVRELSSIDFPETGVRVADDGTLEW